MAVALFGLLKNKLLDCENKEEINKIFYHSLEESVDLLKFTKVLNSTYIDKDIVEKIRSICFAGLNADFNKKTKRKGKNYQSVIKASDITDNLLPVYFNPFFGKKLTDKLNVLSKKPGCLVVPKNHKNYSNLKISFQEEDKSAVISTNTINEQEIELENSNHCILKNLEPEEKEGLNDIFDFIDQDKDISKYSFKFEEKQGMRKVNEFVLINRRSDTDKLKTRKNSLFRPSSPIKEDCDTLIYRFQNQQNKKSPEKETFFDKTNKALSDFHSLQNQEKTKKEAQKNVFHFHVGSQKSSKKTHYTKNENQDVSRRSKRFFSFDSKKEKRVREGSIKIKIKPKGGVVLPEIELSMRKREKSLDLQRGEKVNGFFEGFEGGWDEEEMDQPILPVRRNS